MADLKNTITAGNARLWSDDLLQFYPNGSILKYGPNAADVYNTDTYPLIQTFSNTPAPNDNFTITSGNAGQQLFNLVITKSDWVSSDNGHSDGSVVQYAKQLDTPVKIQLTGAVTGQVTNWSGNAADIVITTTATSDPKLTLAGDVSGEATFTNLGNATLTAVVADNSHNHTSANISDATSANTANKIVKRDGSGNFSAGTITADLTGTASNADKLDNINSTQFLRSDTADIKTSGNLRFNDSVYLTFGTDNDVEHYFGGTNYITTINGGGNWFLRDGNNSDTTRFTFDIDTGNLIGTTFTGALSGNSSTTTKWKTARTLTTTLTGDVNGTANMVVDGNSNQTATIAAVVADDSHNHSNATITSLDGSKITTGTISNDRLPSTLTGDVSGNADTATKWQTTRSFTTTLTGDVTGTATNDVDGTSDQITSINAVVVDDSHNHSFSTGDFTVQSGDLNLVDSSTASIKYNNSTESIDFAFGS